MTGHRGISSSYYQRGKDIYYPTEKEVSDRLDELWDKIQQTPKWRVFQRAKLQEEFEDLQRKEETYKFVGSSSRLMSPLKKPIEVGVQVPYAGASLVDFFPTPVVTSSYSHTFSGLTGATGPATPSKQTTEEILAEIRDFLKKTRTSYLHGGTMIS